MRFSIKTCCLLNFLIYGTLTHTVVRPQIGCEVSSTTTLLEYLRRTLELRGTKYMCLEGGCGACIVSAVKKSGDAPQGVNSCMVSITSCQDWAIETIEKVGNRKDGYHKLQSTLAESNGSQCGYCSPGFVMNIYSLLKAKKHTMLEIEKALGSNVCRCTGYVPILNAFKKFASDAPTQNLLDIEDLKICNRSGKICSQETCEEYDWCLVSENDINTDILHLTLYDDKEWYRPNTVSDVFAIWAKKGVESYMLVAGNTAKGVNPILEYPKLLIDISGLSELKGHYVDQNLVIRGGTTLADVISIFTTEVVNDGFSYLNVLKEHLELVAHTTIRNLATLAGNLMTKNQYPDFKSDIYILLEMVGATITIMKGVGNHKALSTQAFLKEDMKGKILLNVILPPLSTENKIVSYKIMPRYQNAHALIHAGFLYKIDKTNKVLVSRIVIGGLSTQFIRASKTELYLKGKTLFVNETLAGALAVLNNEMVVVESLPDPPVAYRRQAALGLFYKGLLALCPKKILGARYLSGGTKLRDSRPVSEGSEFYDTNPALWPLTQPSPKFEALVQCAGEAKYTDDIPSLPGEVFIAYVPAKVPLGTITKIDASKALSDPEVIAFYSVTDIPGTNSFTTFPNVFNTANEELFCNGEVKYYDQPIGIIVAESQIKADIGATLVEVQYSNVRKPVIDVKVAKSDPARVSIYTTIPSTSKGTDIVKVIKGSNTIYAQYHFTMETIVSVVHPTEDGLKIFAASQWLDLIQQATSKALNLDQSRIIVVNNRCGGAFGVKLSRTNQNALSAALACYKLNRPCRFIYHLTTTMRSVGKRMPCSRDFEVGVNASGVIQYVNYGLYSDNGYIINEPLISLGVDLYYNCYRKDRWNYTAYNVITDTASNTLFRSPGPDECTLTVTTAITESSGSLEAIKMAEMMIERIAYELNLDPLEVRLANLDTENYGDLKEMLETIKTNSKYSERKTTVDAFNKNNIFKKRGLRFCFLRWAPSGYQNFDVNLSVYSEDGTVVITHGGIEMGQGVNTKAIQICAYMLKISVDKIKVKPNDTIISPNGTGSGGSITSQNIGLGVRRCCEELLTRLAPIRTLLINPTWVELVKAAYVAQVDLQVHGFTRLNDTQIYNICGVTLAEVEIDVLTGEYQILQVDLIEDAGQCVNPELDIGQVRGAFVMGVGYDTSENFVYESSTGEVLTNRTWNYWVPQATDIPQVFNIHLKKRSYSSDIIFGSKATGEPATCMSVAVNFAMRAAIAEARLDSGIPTTQWFQIDGPFTVDKICTSAAKKWSEFKFY